MSMEEPQQKKPKMEEKAAAALDSAADDNNEPVAAQRNEDDEAYFEISSKRRVTVREYKGKALVDIREFYEKNDQLLPGKKGISLTLEQYQALRDLIADGAIDKEIEELEKKL